MKEYDRSLRSRVNIELKRYTGPYEGKPIPLPRSHRVLTIFVRLQAESVNSFLPRQSFEKSGTNGHLTNNLLTFTTSASLNDFNQRMIDQIQRYSELKPEQITPEWRVFAERNRAEIDRLSPLISLVQTCKYKEAS